MKITALLVPLAVSLALFVVYKLSVIETSQDHMRGSMEKLEEKVRHQKEELRDILYEDNTMLNDNVVNELDRRIATKLAQHAASLAALMCANSTAPCDPTVSQQVAEEVPVTVDADTYVPLGLSLGTLGEETHRLIQYIFQYKFECPSPRRVGGRADGDGVWNICWRPALDAPGCIVYSVGIEFDWSFGDTLAAHCEVHSFDPTIHKADAVRPKGDVFHNLGLAGVDRPQGPKPVKTLGSIMNQLGHQRLDILKFDTEGDEWATLEDMLQDGSLQDVDQIAFEIHLWCGPVKTADKIRKWLELLRHLEAIGFRLWYSHLNPLSTWEALGESKRTACCYELSYVNSKSTMWER